MTREETRKAAEIMLAYAEGAEIEHAFQSHNAWGDALPSPSWSWATFDYRIKETQDSINWDHIAPGYNWMARDEGGAVYLYSHKSKTYEGKHAQQWEAQGGYDACITGFFASYQRGTCDWKGSLVQRPQEGTFTHVEVAE